MTCDHSQMRDGTICFNCGATVWLINLGSKKQRCGLIAAAFLLAVVAMPNPSLTPGATFPVTKEDVCVPGYSKMVRHVPESYKREAFYRYHLKNVPGKYEVDHLISLELGGSNAIENLWPEPYRPKPGAREKDVVENWLHRQVCSDKMDLKEAQREISTDWYAVYKRIKGLR